MIELQLSWPVIVIILIVTKHIRFKTWPSILTNHYFQRAGKYFLLPTIYEMYHCRFAAVPNYSHARSSINFRLSHAPNATDLSILGNWNLLEPSTGARGAKGAICHRPQVCMDPQNITGTKNCFSEYIM